MSKKTRVIVFTENNARILTNPPNIEDWEFHPHAIVNPLLPRGVPLHFLKQDNGKILEMSRPEKLARLAHIERHGVINDIPAREDRGARPVMDVITLTGPDKLRAALIKLGPTVLFGALMFGLGLLLG